MSRIGGWENERFEHGYFEADSVSIPCSILVLTQEIYDVLVGNIPGTVEYFADVTFGDSLTALENIDEIYIDRDIERVAGTCHIGFNTGESSIAGLEKGAEIIVTSGIRFDGKTAYQKRFHGKIETVIMPSKGKMRGTIDAYDNGIELTRQAHNAQTLIGDVLTWIQGRCDELDLGTGFQIVPKTAGITLVNTHLMSYQSFSEAILAVINGFKTHHAFFSGQNELIILDPTTLSAETPLFTLTDKGIQKYQEIENGTERYNRIPYSNYTGYSKNFVTYAVNVQPDGTSSITGVSIAGNGFLAGVYDDTADQATRGIMSHPGAQNNICADEAELEAYCASVADESQRQRLNMDLAHNPFVDLGSVLSYNSQNYFISRIRDRIQAGSPWKTQLEIRAAA